MFAQRGAPARTLLAVLLHDGETPVGTSVRGRDCKEKWEESMLGGAVV